MSSSRFLALRRMWAPRSISPLGQRDRRLGDRQHPAITRGCRAPAAVRSEELHDCGSWPAGVCVQLFISHSGKDREWVELVCKRIEAAGFTAYLAEYDIAGIGQDLTPKLCDAITASAATVVIMTENAAGSPIVREEIGFALGQGKLVLPLVTPDVARNPAALGMLNGREYIPFDIAEPHEGLLKLTDWVNQFARRQQDELHQAQLAAQHSEARAKDQAIAQLQAQNEAATLLLVLVAALAVTMLLAKSS